MHAGEVAASPQQLTQALEEYLAAHPAAALLEDGRVLFDMRSARYAVTESHGRCLLQLLTQLSVHDTALGCLQLPPCDWGGVGMGWSCGTTGSTKLAGDIRIRKG